jgi:hypothetical protein
VFHSNYDGIGNALALGFAFTIALIGGALWFAIHWQGGAVVLTASVIFIIWKLWRIYS